MVQSQSGQIQVKQQTLEFSQSHSILLLQQMQYSYTTSIFGEYVSKLLDIAEDQAQAPTRKLDNFNWSRYTINNKFIIYGPIPEL